MKKYLITYNLKAQNWNYSKFFTALQNIGEWWHYIDSTWIVKTNLTPQEIYNLLIKNITTNDSLLIIEIDPKNKHGYLPHDAWTWIDN